MANKSEDLSSIQADVASFLSGLGFSDGFDDSDFRKKGRISDSKPAPAPKVPIADKPWRSSEPKRAGKKSKASENDKLKNSVFKEISRSEHREKPYAKREARESLSRTRETGKGEKAVNSRESNGMSSENEPGEKERAGLMAKSKEDTNARRIGNVSSKKRKAVFAETNHSANGKKLKFSNSKNPGLLNQSRSTKENLTKEGSKSLSRIMSLLESGSWYEVSTSFAMMNGKNKAVNGENQCVVKNNDGLEWNALVENVTKKGEQLIEMVAAEYEKRRGKDSDMRWVMMARKTGTTADKVAAFTVLLQDNAIANLRSLDALLALVTSKGGKRHAGMGMDALKELFVTSLLPERKLKFLMQQPIQAQVGTWEEECQMVLWYWEDCLKQRYEHFIAALEEASKDNLPFLKEKALKTIYELLKSKPEQEQRLLSALVNKLGDPERKTASNAGYYLSCLVTAHPNMKMVVVQEVDIFLFRPHLGLRSKYQAAVFLNQIMLSNRGNGPKLARRLIDIYFSLFKVITTGKPHSSHEKEWSSRKNQRKANKVEEEDGGAVEIDSRLLSALLTGVNRAFPYVAAEEVDTVIEEHTPVLFRLVHSKSFNVGVQALMLLYQLMTKKNAISDHLYRSLYAVLLSPGLSKSSKMEMFLGLLFKAIKSDINSKRMAAFAKRLMQVALQGAPQFACGCLLLLSEVLKSRPTFWHAISYTEDADDEIEHFEDVKDNDMSRTDMLYADNLADSPQNQSADNEVECGRWLKEGRYNARHRDPSFCNADRACWWELIALKFHAHPSVAAMAKTLLSGASILYDGDPLRDLAVGAFLDRFAEKKPKAYRRSETWHGSLPLAPSKKVSPLPVGRDFLNLTEKEVAPEDVIFYKFYTAKAGRKTKSIKFDKREEDILLTGDDDMLGDGSDDDEIDALLDEDEGAEMGLDNLSEEDDESDGEWTYHQQTKGDLNALNGEHIGSAEDNDFEGLIEASSDEDYKTHSFDGKNANESGFQESMKQSVKLKSSFNKSARRHSQSKLRKEERGKEKKAFKNKGVAKSPFADIDEYSHILKHETTGAERRFTSSKRKPK